LSSNDKIPVGVGVGNFSKVGFNVGSTVALMIE
jgi:hypothetical protein